MSLPRILIASRIPSTSVGGLASYQHWLGGELVARGMAEVDFFCSESLPPPKYWMTLAARPKTHGLLAHLIGRHYSRTLKKLASQKYHVVHFVGTGWDFSGFAMHSLAGDLGAGFTIWPAVHSGQWGDDKIDLRLYRRADAVFCQSRHEEEHLESLGLEASKIARCLLPPMCLPGRTGHRLRERLGIGTRPAVLFLGRRDQAKGYPALLKAWPAVLSSHPDAVLLVSGPGGGEYEALRQGLPPDSLRDLGISDEETKAQALAACTVFCLPSAHESFGIVFAEAWSYGKPVLCGPSPAAREWIEDGVAGVHADQKPSAIAQALRWFLDHPELAAQMGSEGKKYQENHLTWEGTLASHLAAFRI